MREIVQFNQFYAAFGLPDNSNRNPVGTPDLITLSPLEYIGGEVHVLGLFKRSEFTPESTMMNLHTPAKDWLNTHIPLPVSLNLPDHNRIRRLNYGSVAVHLTGELALRQGNTYRLPENIYLKNVCVRNVFDLDALREYINQPDC